MLFTIFFLIKRPSKIFLRPKFILPQLILTFLFLISCFSSTNPGFSFPQFFIWLDCWLMIDLFLLSQIPSSILTNTIIKLATIYSLVFIFLKIQPLEISFFTDGDAFISPYLPNVQLSNFLILAIPIVYYYQNIKHRSLILLTLCMALFVCNSRSSIITTIIGLELINHFKPQTYFPRLRIYLIAFLVFYLSFFIFGKQYTTNKSPIGSRQLYWYQAIKGLQENPLFGIGPSNFLYTSVKYQNTNTRDLSMNAHNVILHLLAENGLIFTLIFFGLIIFGLQYQFNQNQLFFIIGLISFFNGSFSSAWASPGILIISLIFIFYNSNLAITTKKNSLSIFLATTILVVLILHTLRLIKFHQLILKENYYQAVYLYPYNLDVQLQIIKRYHDLNQFSPFFKNDFRVYETIIKSISLPRSEKYYFLLLRLDQHHPFSIYNDLIEYYINTNNSRVEEIFSNFIKFVPIAEKHQFSYFLNRYANLKKSNFYFEKSIEIAPTWGPLYIDYANYLWHNQQKDKATLVLLNCQKFKPSQQECQEYFNSNDFQSFLPGTYPIPSPEQYDAPYMSK